MWFFVFSKLKNIYNHFCYTSIIETSKTTKFENSYEIIMQYNLKCYEIIRLCNIIKTSSTKIIENSSEILQHDTEVWRAECNEANLKK